MLLPSLTQARLVARRTQCAANMHNLGIAALTYSSDYDFFVPVFLHEPMPQWFPSWRLELLVYTGTRSVFDCPMTKKPWTDAMGANSGSIGVMYQTAYNYKGPHFAWPEIPAVDYVASRWIAWPLTPGVGWKDPPNSVYLGDSYASDVPPMYPCIEWIGTNHIHPNSYPSFWTGTGGSRRFAERHLGTNIYFLDGHAEVRRAYDLDRMVIGASNNVWDVY